MIDGETGNPPAFETFLTTPTTVLTGEAVAREDVDPAETDLTSGHAVVAHQHDDPGYWYGARDRPDVPAPAAH